MHRFALPNPLATEGAVADLACDPLANDKPSGASAPAWSKSRRVRPSQNRLLEPSTRSIQYSFGRSRPARNRICEIAGQRNVRGRYLTFPAGTTVCSLTLPRGSWTAVDRDVSVRPGGRSVQVRVDRATAARRSVPGRDCAASRGVRESFPSVVDPSAS